ncbi:MAG: flagellar basal body rod protein FlgC [Clostridiaceae bacterium]|nr:flagellar basal body rod protein FlgC [Clostridiaceae bacterium]
MGFFSALHASASALTAQRLRMDIISENIANVNTTRTEDGTPYRRKTVIFEARNGNTPFSSYLTNASKKLISNGGVRVSGIVEDQTPFKSVYDPGHPDADENGMVQMPNVDVVTEMVNLISASRAYEANITSIDTTKSMALKALEIGR